MTENSNPPKKRGRPQKWMFQKDFDNFVAKEWNPFRYNDWVHLKSDVAWIKYLLGGMIITLIAAAIAILATT